MHVGQTVRCAVKKTFLSGTINKILIIIIIMLICTDWWYFSAVPAARLTQTSSQSIMWQSGQDDLLNFKTEPQNGEKKKATLVTLNKGVFIDQPGWTRWADLNISDATDLLGFSCRADREWPEKEKISSEWHFRRKDCSGLTETQQSVLLRQKARTITSLIAQGAEVDGARCVCSNTLASLVATSLNQDVTLSSLRSTGLPSHQASTLCKRVWDVVEQKTCNWSAPLKSVTDDRFNTDQHLWGKFPA